MGTILDVNVLVVDDDRAVRESGAEVLRGAGLTVVSADDGETALKMLGEVRPQVILLDLRMPRVDGMTFIASLEGRAPVIVMSGQVDDEVRRSLAPKVSEILVKPVPPLVLIDRVVAVCTANPLPG